MIKGIVFDLDGTLVDSLSTTFDAFNHAITLHGGHKHTAEEILKYFGPGESQIFAQILGPEKAQSAYRASRDYMDSQLGAIPLHAGVGDLLEQIKSEGVPISIFTGRSWDTTELILKHHRILDRFITVVANDHTAAPKPSPEGLLLALKRMGLDPSEAVLVGDSPVDMMAAKFAKSGSVAALWDLLAKKSALELHSPHHWAQTPAEVWKIWESTSRE